MAHETPIDPHNPPAGLRILAVDYFRANMKCVYQPCDKPVVAIRVTQVDVNERELLLVATICQDHVDFEREDIQRLVASAAIQAQPNRN